MSTPNYKVRIAVETEGRSFILDAEGRTGEGPRVFKIIGEPKDPEDAEVLADLLNESLRYVEDAIEVFHGRALP